MAKKINSTANKNKKKKRQGVVARTRSSNHKHSKNYQKKYRGQGKTR